MEPIFLPVVDACRSIGISRSTLYKLIAAGEIETRKLGRKTLIARAELLALAERLPTGSKKPEAA